jgi:hypothetical protein
MHEAFPPFLELFCGSFVAFAIYFLGQHYMADAAMVPPGILSQRVVCRGFLTAFFQLGGLYVLAYHTHVWFQVVKGTAPLLSGVFALLKVLSQIISAVMSGILGIWRSWLGELKLTNYSVSRLGYYLPWAIVGSLLTSIGSDLMSKESPGSPERPD